MGRENGQFHDSLTNTPTDAPREICSIDHHAPHGFLFVTAVHTRREKTKLSEEITPQGTAVGTDIFDKSVGRSHG